MPRQPPRVGERGSETIVPQRVTIDPPPSDASVVSIRDAHLEFTNEVTNSLRIRATNLVDGSIVATPSVASIGAIAAELNRRMTSTMLYGSPLEPPDAVAQYTARVVVAGEDLEPGVAVCLRGGRAHECPTLLSDGTTTNPEWVGVVDPFLPKIIRTGGSFRMLVRAGAAAPPAEPPPTRREQSDSARGIRLTTRDGQPIQVIRATFQTVPSTGTREWVPPETNVILEVLDGPYREDLVISGGGIDPHELIVMFEETGLPGGRVTTTIRGRIGRPIEEQSSWSAEDLIRTISVLSREMVAMSLTPSVVVMSPEAADQLRLVAPRQGLSLRPGPLTFCGLRVVESSSLATSVAVRDNHDRYRMADLRYPPRRPRDPSALTASMGTIRSGSTWSGPSNSEPEGEDA